MQFLVLATSGPGFASPAEAAQLLDKLVLPSMDTLIGWEKANILTGGLPVGGRAFAFIVEADSNGSLDAMLRALPIWGVLDWEVTPLTSFSERAALDREHLQKIS